MNLKVKVQERAQLCHLMEVSSENKDKVHDRERGSAKKKSAVCRRECIDRTWTVHSNMTGEGLEFSNECSCIQFVLFSFDHFHASTRLPASSRILAVYGQNWRHIRSDESLQANGFSSVSCIIFSLDPYTSEKLRIHRIGHEKNRWKTKEKQIESLLQRPSLICAVKPQDVYIRGGLW